MPGHDVPDHAQGPGKRPYPQEPCRARGQDAARAAEKQKDSFTAEEVRKLFKYLPHDKTGDSIRLLLLTGMRSQELLALEAGHIEPDGSCIHIRQAVKQVKGTVFVGETKSASSVRDVPIPEAYRGMVAGCASTARPISGRAGAWTSPATRRISATSLPKR